LFVCIIVPRRVYIYNITTMCLYFIVICNWTHYLFDVVLMVWDGIIVLFQLIKINFNLLIVVLIFICVH
jgi:hypothetical protein